MAVIVAAGLLATRLLFVSAARADQELPDADTLPMKFGLRDEPLQLEPRKRALLMLPWLAVVVIAAQGAFMVVAAAPAALAALATAIVLAAFGAGQLYFHRRLDRFLKRRPKG